MATEERQGVIHTAADGQRRAIGVRFLNRTTQPVKAGIGVNKGGDLRSWVTEDHAQLPTRGTVIVSRGMVCVLNLSTYVAVEEVSNAPYGAVVNCRVANGAIDPD